MTYFGSGHRAAAAARLNLRKAQVSLRRKPRDRLARLVTLCSRVKQIICEGVYKDKGPSRKTGPIVGTLTMTYFHAVYPALSSALRRFTVLFGMGRRGSNALWSSENSVSGLDCR